MLSDQFPLITEMIRGILEKVRQQYGEISDRDFELLLLYDDLLWTIEPQDLTWQAPEQQINEDGNPF